MLFMESLVKQWEMKCFVNAEGSDLFCGQHRFEARRTVEEALKEKGLFRKKDLKHKMALGFCSMLAFSEPSARQGFRDLPRSCRAFEVFDTRRKDAKGTKDAK